MTIEEALKSETQGGEELEAKMASGLHGVIGGFVTRHLGNHVYPNKLGWVFNSTTTFKVSGQPPTRQPDAAFVALERMPTPPDEDVPFAPDLAVEVISRNDDWSEVVAKANEYLQAGTRLVWVVDPYTKGVFIFQANVKPILLSSEDELDGDKVVLGFKLKVGMLFE